MKEIPVTFKNENQKMVGILHLPDKKTKSAVIIAHGFTGHKRETIIVNTARKLAEKGFSVLRFDFRGSGDSDGLFRNMTISSEISDLEKAIQFMRKKGYTKIGLVGHSLGGSVVILVNKQYTHSIVLWAPCTPLKKSFTVILGNKIKAIETQDYAPVAWYGKGIEFIVGRPLWKEIKNKLPNIINDFLDIKIPKTVIYGNKDLILLEDTDPKDFKKLKHPDNNLRIIKGCDHAFSKYEHEKQLINYTVEWFKKWLK